MDIFFSTAAWINNKKLDTLEPVACCVGNGRGIGPNRSLFSTTAALEPVACCVGTGRGIGSNKSLFSTTAGKQFSKRHARDADCWKLFSDLPMVSWKTLWKTRGRREEDAVEDAQKSLSLVGRRSEMLRKEKNQNIFLFLSNQRMSASSTRDRDFCVSSTRLPHVFCASSTRDR